MGVQGLIALLRKHAPAAFDACTEADLRGRRVGIDLSITLYRGAAVAYKHGPLSHLEALARELRWLLRLGCEPIYVLDGRAPVEKHEELAKREATRAENEQRLRDFMRSCAATLHEEETQLRLQALQKRCIRMTEEMRNDARSLLEALGVQLVQAETEAEHCLAELMRQGRVDHVFTEDVDVLICGAASYVKNSTLLMYASENDACGYVSASPSKKVAEIVRLDAALAGLQLSREGFALLAVFSGCDFAPKLPRFGPATALKHVVKHQQDLEACFSTLSEEHKPLQARYTRAVELFLAPESFVEVPLRAEAREELGPFLQALQAQGSVAYLQTLVADVLELQGSALPSERPSKRMCLEKKTTSEGFNSPKGKVDVDAAGSERSLSLGMLEGDGWRVGAEVI